MFNYVHQVFNVYYVLQKCEHENDTLPAINEGIVFNQPGSYDVHICLDFIYMDFSTFMCSYRRGTKLSLILLLASL